MPIISAFPTGESTVDYTGPKSGLPSLEEGKVAYVTDEKRLYTGNADGTNTQIPNADDVKTDVSDAVSSHNSATDAHSALFAKKQDKFTGKKGKFVGFTADNVLGAVDAPSGGVNPNLLDNWYFGNPVNQRGQTEYTGNATYSIDRWWTQYETTLSIVDGGIKIGDKWDVQQYFETTLPNATYTLSLLYKDRTGSDPLRLLIGNRTDGDLAQTESKDASGILSVTFSTAKLNKVNFGFTGSTDNSATIIAIKLELGDTQTLAHKENGVWVLNEIPDFGEQLARCQRYYRRWTGADNKPLGVAVRRESKLLELVFSLDTAMRVAPSLTFNGSFVCVPTFTWCSVTSIDVATPDTVAVFLKPNDDVTFDLDAYQINIAYANEYIALSADL